MLQRRGCRNDCVQATLGCDFPSIVAQSPNAVRDGDKEENMVGRSRRFWHVAFLAVPIYVGLFGETVLYIDAATPRDGHHPHCDLDPVTWAEGFGLGGRSLALGPANHDAGQRSRGRRLLVVLGKIAQPHSASVSTVCCSLSR